MTHVGLFVTARRASYQAFSGCAFVKPNQHSGNKGKLGSLPRNPRLLRSIRH